MIKIEKILMGPIEPVIRGMRNPMNSWAKSDTEITEPYGGDIMETGPEDLKLMRKLALAGPEHAKYRRMIVVWCDITAPLYWWKEFDTYKVGTVANSCSTMHYIHKKEFTTDDFSHEHLITMPDICQEIPFKDIIIGELDEDLNFTQIVRPEIPAIATGPVEALVPVSPRGVLYDVIRMLNRCRELYLETNDKKYWWQMIQLLPSSYNQKRTVMLNYEVLASIYRQRKNHKLDEWRHFCNFIERLPLAQDIIFPEEGEEEWL